MVERAKRTLVPVTQAKMKDERSWDRALQKVQFDLNTFVNKTIRQTPYKLLMVYNPSVENAKMDRTNYRQLAELRKMIRRLTKFSMIGKDMWDTISTM